MKYNTVLRVLLFAWVLGISTSTQAVAASEGHGCSILGTWYGVESPTDTRFTGWMASVMGKSSDQGTNNLEYPTFDVTLGGLFPQTERISTLRGAWERTGGNTFQTTMIAIAVAADGTTPVWIGKLITYVTIVDNCSVMSVTGTMTIYPPTESPLDGIELFTAPLPLHYGYRAYVQAQ